MILTINPITVRIPSMTNLNDALRAAIEADGRTRYAIAKAAGLTEATLWRLWHAEGGVSILTAERLAKALGKRVVLVDDRKAVK